MNLDRFHNRILKVCALVAVTLILPALAYAQAGGPLAALQAQVAALQSAVATLRTDNSALQSQVSSLQSQLAAVQSNDSTLQSQINVLQTQVGTVQSTPLQSQISTLQSQLNAAHNVLALAPFVSVDPDPQLGVIGPNVTFSGANIHIVSGRGGTPDTVSGLGKLIIGYDEVTRSAKTWRPRRGAQFGDRRI